MTRTHSVETSLGKQNKISLSITASCYSHKTRSKNCKTIIFKMSSNGATKIIERMETVSVEVAVEDPVSDVVNIKRIFVI